LAARCAALFAKTADLRPYDILMPEVDLKEKNPPRDQRPSTRRCSISLARRRDDDLFNRILWSMIKGEDAPYPGRRGCR